MVQSPLFWSRVIEGLCYCNSIGVGADANVPFAVKPSVLKSSGADAGVAFRPRRHGR